MICSDLPESTEMFSVDLYRPCDLTDKHAITELAESFQPDWIINCAAFTNVDGAEEQRELCWQVNVDAVENIAYAARKCKASVLQVSTDYIFNGQDGPYTEDDTPDALGYYGRSKLAAENVLKTSTAPFAIARTMVLYGHSKNKRPDFVGWLVGQLQQGNPVRIVTDQIGNTTLNDDLARGLLKIVEKDFHGVVNVAGRDIVSRYDFALEIADVFGLDASLIQPITTEELGQKAPRPLNSGLVVDKAVNELGMNLMSMRQGLLEYKSTRTAMD